MGFLAGLFLVGLLLWWIIKSDLKERDFQKQCREENEKREAREQTAAAFEAAQRRITLENQDRFRAEYHEAKKK